MKLANIARRLWVAVCLMTLFAGFASIRADSANALGPYTLDGAAWTTPGAYAQGPLTLAVRVTTTNAGWITKVRFFKDVIFTGPHTAFVWDVSGNVIGTEVFGSETESGWQEITLASPVAITAGSTFSVGYTLENGFVANAGRFPTRTFGPLTIVNGYYIYQASTFPNQSVGNNYHH